MPTVRTGPVVGLVGQLVVLGGPRRHRRPRLRPAGWPGSRSGWSPAGLGCCARCRGSGPADRVTLARATLVGGVTALVADSFAAAGPGRACWSPLAAVALVLDAVDGWVARRTGTVSALGARFDMEVDAFLILVLSAYVADSLGGWVLAIGLMRYAFVAAGWVLPWLRGRAAAALLAQGRRGDPGRRARGRGVRPAAAAGRRSPWWRSRWRCWSSRSAATSGWLWRHASAQ